MKSSELSESEFREIIGEHLLPFLPKAELRDRVAPTLVKSDKLVVQEGNNSATSFILKAAADSAYRIRLWRSQPFSPEEKKLMECFLTALAGRDLPSTGAHRRDTLTSIVNETVARFAAPDAKNFVLDLLHSLTEWAQQTYEGDRIAFSAGVLNVRVGEESGIEFSSIANKDFVKVLSNAQDTLLIFDRNGRLQRHESCVDFQFPPNSPRITARRFVPIRFDNFAKWSAQNSSAVIVTLTRHGEILIFRNGDLLMAKRRGVWRYFTHEICLKQITNKALAKKSSKEFREELYLTALDVAFTRKGGCIGVLRKDFEILGIKPVGKQDRLRELSATSDTAMALKAVISNRPFQKLDRILRTELAGIDGSLVLDYKGNVLAVGAILSIESRSEDGGGRQAAAENLSKHGLGLKISNDGYIRAFGKKKRSLQLAESYTVHLTQSQLESYLWGAATLLRGHIDAGDYKQFIFPLLFYKRLCDVYDEELAEALAESGGDADYAALPEQHRFQIPAEAHWSATRAKVKNVGKAIQEGLRAIEKSNPDTLYGVFGDAQWTNKDRLPDDMLRDLIEHFSSQTLSLAHCPEDELGVGYEFLIKKFADDSGHTAAEFYTNRTVVHLMTEMLQPKPGESIYDPTCGSAGMLLSAVTHLKRQGKEWRNLRLYGQERNLLTTAIGRMNLFLHGIEDFRVVRGDTLAQPAFVEADRLQQFDVVLANPPYSIKQWDRDAWASDPWGRNIYGTPPQGRADYAFWQHINQSMNPKTGRCAILFPHGVLFRNEEQAMREKLIAHDLVECVLGLGPNLFYNSPMEACVVLCRMNKPKARRNKVLFINAVNEVTRERAQSFLTDEHIDRIVTAYEAFADVDGLARVVENEFIRQQGCNLSIPLYVRAEASGNGRVAESPAEYGDGDLKGAIVAWQESSVALRASMSQLFDTLVGDSKGSLRR